MLRGGWLGSDIAKDPKALASLDWKRQQSVVIASLGETDEGKRNSHQ